MLSISYASINVRSFENGSQNQSIPNIQLQNSDRDIFGFSLYSPSNVVHSKIYMDDEDSDNANSWEWYDSPSEIKERINVIMSGSSNTVYYAVKWIELVLNKILNWLGV